MTPAFRIPGHTMVMASGREDSSMPLTLVDPAAVHVLARPLERLARGRTRLQDPRDTPADDDHRAEHAGEAEPDHALMLVDVPGGRTGLSVNHGQEWT